MPKRSRKLDAEERCRRAEAAWEKKYNVNRRKMQARGEALIEKARALRDELPRTRNAVTAKCAEFKEREHHREAAKTGRAEGYKIPVAQETWWANYIQAAINRSPDGVLTAEDRLLWNRLSKAERQAFSRRG